MANTHINTSDKPNLFFFFPFFVSFRRENLRDNDLYTGNE